MKDFKAAVEPLLRILTYQPNNPEALTNLGYAYTQQRHYREAVVLVHKAVTLKPKLTEAQVLPGGLYLLTKNRNGRTSTGCEGGCVRCVVPVLACVLCAS